MKNLFKKISALVLTAIMVLTMCSAVFADGTTLSKPSAGDKASITVNNVEAGATVTAYRVVKPVYTNEGFEKYETVSNVTIKDPVKPTVVEIVNIAKGIADGTITGLDSVTLNLDAQTGSYTTNQAGAGYWVVLVTGNVNKVYNPMLAGVYYSVEGSGSSNELKNEAIDASQKWELNGSIAHEKSVEVDQTVNKKITDNTEKDKKGEIGDDIAVGDYTKFEVTATIPGYTAAYTQVTYKITDTLDETLTAENTTEHPVKVYVGANEADSAKYTLKVEDHKIIVDFDSAYAITNAGKIVKLTYAAKLTGTTKTNFNANVNKVKVTYSNDPTVGEDGKTPTKDTAEKYTYHYTFELGGHVNGAGSDVTTEFTKTGEEVIQGGVTEHKPLPGAKFTLTNVKNTNKVYTATSAENTGALNFKGLDAGEYTLKETEAPNGYSLNSTVYTVIIDTTYNTDNGRLATYSVTIKDGETLLNKITYSNNGETVERENNNTTVEIKNTKLSSLPSTGGMGTYLFTIVGVVLMTCAAGAFFVSRRKANK